VIKTGRQITSDVSLTCDVVIVGSGAGGGPLAGELAMAGLDVVVLEKGAFTTAKDFTQDWGTMYGKIEGRRGLGTSRDNGINLSFAETLGGTTVHYWANSYRTPADRIERWNREFGLGFDPAGLAPLFRRLENNLSVHRTHDYLANATNRLMRLGAHTMRERSGDSRYRGTNAPQATKGCIGCGFREVGCAYNHKQSQLISYLPIASRSGAKIFADCDVRDLIVSNGRAVGVRGVVRTPRDGGPTGPKVEVRARQAVVVAGSALTTPELLLRSGLSNANIGRFLTIAPTAYVWGVFPEALNFRKGSGEAWSFDGFSEVRRDAAGNYVDGGWYANPDNRDPATTAPLIGFAGDELRERLAEFPRLTAAFSEVDDDPHAENVVSLDSDGNWQVDYQLRGEDGLKALDSLRKVCRVLFAAGFERLYIPWRRTIERGATDAATEANIDGAVAEITSRPSDLSLSGAHLLSTARWGDSASTSVCGPDGQAHELPGLYVAGGAAVPTGAATDPSFTIMCFSLVLARELLKPHGKDLVKLRWKRSRMNHTSIVGGPSGALGYDGEQRRIAAGKVL
jgi:choline dehydrogenase-like flavoprotein